MPRITDSMDETHRSHRAPWLRAAILGANDGIVSTASLLVGVSAASAVASTATIATAGVAGLVGGALSMAAGEYVSVASQRDAELADLQKEMGELERFPDAELRELTEIYVKRGLERSLATEVATQLTAHDALATHLRDELNLDRNDLADPRRAAITSAVSFFLGAAIPLLAALLSPSGARVAIIAASAAVALAVLGIVGARLGGSLGPRGALRVLGGGLAAMAITALIGRWVGTFI